MTCQLFLLAISLAVAGASSFFLEPASDKLIKRGSGPCQKYKDCLSPLQGEGRRTVCYRLEHRNMNCEDEIRSSCGEDAEKHVMRYLTMVDHVAYSCQPEVKAELKRLYAECMRSKLTEIHREQRKCSAQHCPNCKAPDESCHSVNTSRRCMLQGINTFCPGSEAFHHDYYNHYFSRMAQFLNCPWP